MQVYFASIVFIWSLNKDDDQRYSGKIPVKEKCLGVMCKVGDTLKTIGETILKPVLEIAKIAGPIMAASGG